MSGYSFDKNYEVTYADCTHRDEIKPSALLTYAQEGAGQSAAELGFGYDDTIKDGCGFFIASTYCEIFAPIHPYDILQVSSWPLPPRHVIFQRDYDFKRDGKRVAVMASRWCLVELASGKMLPPERLRAHSTTPYRNEQVTSPDFSLPKLKGEGERVYSLVVRPSHLDHFNHVNNTKYADFFMDCFSKAELEKRVKSFRIAYSKQVKEGEELTFFRKDTEGGVAFEARIKDEVTTRFFVTFEENL